MNTGKCSKTHSLGPYTQLILLENSSIFFLVLTWKMLLLTISFLHIQGEVTPFKNYLHRFSTPYYASKSSNPLWYAIRRASAHIIVLSSYSPFGNYFQHLYICKGFMFPSLYCFSYKNVNNFVISEIHTSMDVAARRIEQG